MKRSTLILAILALFAVAISGFAATPAVQTRHHRRHHRTFYQMHRDKIHVAAGAGIGAIAGGLIGGKRGAGIGLLAGGGGTALYKYKKHKRRHRHYRRP